MKQLWLVITFLVVMLLIGYAWQSESVTAGGAGVVDGGATALSAPASAP